MLILKLLNNNIVIRMGNVEGAMLNVKVPLIRGDFTLTFNIEIPPSKTHCQIAIYINVNDVKAELI